MKMKRTAAIVIMVLFASVSVRACVDTITLDRAGWGAKGTTNIYGGGNNGTNVYAGLLKMEVLATSGVAEDFDIGSTIGVFCIDLVQYADNDTRTFDAIEPEDGPNPTDFLSGPMGQEKAELLSELWGRFYDSTWLTSLSYTSEQNTAAEAFQVCIWKSSTKIMEPIWTYLLTEHAVRWVSKRQTQMSNWLTVCLTLWTEPAQRLLLSRLQITASRTSSQRCLWQYLNRQRLLFWVWVYY